MSTLLGDARIRIRPDLSGFENEANKGIGGAMKKAALAAGAAFAAVGVGSVLKDAISKASDLNETVNKSNVIFGKNAAEINKWSQGAAKNFGLSRQAALDAAAGMGNMLQQLGYAPEAAAKASTGTVKLAADLGSFNNLDTSDVLDRIGAAMRGEYDSLQALIPNINAARVEQVAMNETGKTSAKTLTAQEKAHATLSIIQKDGAAAQNDFAETSNGLANRTKIASAQFDDMKSRIGQALLPAMTGLMTFVSETALPGFQNFGGYLSTNLGPTFDKVKGYVFEFRDAFKAALSGYDVAADDKVSTTAVIIADALQHAKDVAVDLWHTAQTVYDFYKNNQTTLDAIAVGIGTIVLAIKAYNTYLKISQGVVIAYSAAQAALNVVMAANPIGIVILALAGLAAGLVYAYKNSETFREKVQEALAILKYEWNDLKEKWSLAVQIIMAEVDDLRDKYNAAVTIIKSELQSLKDFWQGVKDFWHGIVTVVKVEVDDLVGKYHQGVSLIKNEWADFTGTLSGGWNWVKQNVFIPLGDFITKDVPQKFRDGVRYIRDAWFDIQDAARKPVRFVVETVLNNGLIAGFNKIAHFVTGKDGIGPITLPPGFATGGYTGDGGKYEPKGIVHGGEYVFTKEETRALGVPFLSALGKKVKGYASGGFVPGAAQGIVSLGKWFQGLGARVSEHPAFGGVAPVHKGRGHYEGRAIDVNYGPGGQNATEQAFFDKWANAVAAAGFKVLWRVSGHYNHLHAETGGGKSLLGKIGGALSGALDFLGGLNPLDFLKNKITGLLGGIGSSPLAGMLTGLPGKAADLLASKADDLLSGLFESGGDNSGAPALPGRGVERWRPLVLRALGMVGQPATLANNVLSRMQRESGGDPNAVNNWDINALRGDPSKGLMQVIGATFRRYALPGYNRNVLDPLSNILASMRYGIDRYGSLARAYGQRGGYARGTNSATPGLHLVGEEGPELVSFRGGERVYNNSRTTKMLGGAPLIGGDLVIQSSGNVRNDLAEANFQLRRIRRGGVHSAR